jgi:Ca2+-binding EF-hand superfamily protein
LQRHSFATSSLHNHFIGVPLPDDWNKELSMRILPLIGAASLVAAGAAAFALQGAPHSKMDADGNGVVSKAEAMTAADAMFAKMDENGDGTLSVADREAKMKAHFMEMDADKNGSINEAEFVAAHKERMEDRQAKRAERGVDGEGHRGGKRGHHGGHGMAMMKAADTNNDMAVSKAEFRTAAEARFTKADADKDGSLSAAEQKAARKAMRGPRGDMPPPPPSGA